MDKFREHYLQALGTNDESKLAALQETAHSIRQFEIELYWKRAAYFWAFQLVSFAALGLLFKDGKVTIPQLLAIPSSIGVITAFAGVLTARGSKFWQENWEAHVDLLEGQAGQRLTQVVMCRRPAQFSVSRVNECLLYLLTGSWMVVLVFSAIPQAAGLFVWLSQAYRGIAVLVAVIVACGWMWHSTRTHFTGRIFRLGGTRWTHYKPISRGEEPSIIWRDPLSTESLRDTDTSQKGTA